MLDARDQPVELAPRSTSGGLVSEAQLDDLARREPLDQLERRALLGDACRGP